MDQAGGVDDSIRGKSRVSYSLIAVTHQHTIKRALANQPWKQHTSPEGRPYWYHSETKATTWEMPEVYKNALAQTSQPSKPQIQ